jgi:hypothetical protein
MFLHDYLNWLSRKTSLNLTTVSTTRCTAHVVPSTHVDIIRERVSPEFRSLLTARPTFLRIGVLIGFT